MTLFSVNLDSPDRLVYSHLIKQAKTHTKSRYCIHHTCNFTEVSATPDESEEASNEHISVLSLSYHAQSYEDTGERQNYHHVYRENDSEEFDKKQLMEWSHITVQHEQYAVFRMTMRTSSEETADPLERYTKTTRKIKQHPMCV